MKELSIEEKAKRYDDALKQIKECTPDENGFVTIYPNEIFPELKESEDERLRKTTIAILKLYADKGYESAVECIDWLERQSEQKPVEVEPKFKVGDWVILTAGELSTTLQITNVDINKKLYWFNDGCYLPFADEKCLHLWTIEDAKDGDVLCFNDRIIAIFKSLYNDHLFYSYCHCYVGGVGILISNDKTPDRWGITGFQLATKEQRNLLFARIKENGYEWNADEKVLNKIIVYESKVRE